MPRGFFTQSATVLFSHAPSIETIEDALASLGATLLRRDTSPGWLSGGVELLVPFGDEAKGHVHVDVVSDRWPDSMGDPEQDASLFGAWTMGAFGPQVFPRNLERAAQQAVAFRGAKAAADAHRAFVRLRTSYLVGAGPDSAILPEGWSAGAELDAMLQVARVLLPLDGACAYFDPNAELLLDPRDVVAFLESDEEGGTPLELVSHVRLFNIDPTWALMDTVGLDRFFLPDLEVLITREVDPNQAAHFLRNVSAYLLSKGEVIEDGHVADSPFGPLEVHARDESLTEPPRRVLRMVPRGAQVPDGAL
jgi:hypothetical protein